MSKPYFAESILEIRSCTLGALTRLGTCRRRAEWVGLERQWQVANNALQGLLTATDIITKAEAGKLLSMKLKEEK